MTKIFEIGQKVRLVGYPFEYGAFDSRYEGEIGEVVCGPDSMGDYKVYAPGYPQSQWMSSKNLEELPVIVGTKPDVFIIDEVGDYPKFSPGDRVRRINHDNCEEMVEGTEWTVVDQDGSDLSLEGYRNQTFCSSSWNFELIEQPTFKVGDEVFYEDYMVSGRGEITKMDGPIAYVRVELKDASKAYFGERDRVFDLANLTLIEKPLEDEKVELKVGDRVRIVGDAYVNHPSRMRGGKGRVEQISHSGGLVKVRVDDDPQDRLWSFFSDEVEKIEPLPSLVEIDYGELEQRLLAHSIPSALFSNDWYFDNDKAVEAEENPGVYFVSVPVPNGMKLESVSLTFA